MWQDTKARNPGTFNKYIYSLKNGKTHKNTVYNIGYILYTIARNTKEDLVMPVISRFEGIVIKMYLRQKEHNPPHIEHYRDRLIAMWETQQFEVLPPVK